MTAKHVKEEYDTTAHASTYKAAEKALLAAGITHRALLHTTWHNPADLGLTEKQTELTQAAVRGDVEWAKAFPGIEDDWDASEAKQLPAVSDDTELPAVELATPETDVDAAAGPTPQAPTPTPQEPRQPVPVPLPQTDGKAEK